MIGTDDKLPDVITFKNVISIKCVIKDDGKFYMQIFLNDTLLVK